MSKKNVDLTSTVMSRIKKNHIAMKPRWYFVLGTLALISGLVGLSIVLVFLVNLTVFSLRTHGPMGDMRYQQLLASFPWWIPLIVVIGLGLGIYLLKQYDFSYKKNFLFVILGFVAAILLSGVVADALGINMFLSRQRQMRRIYQQVEHQNLVPQKGSGQRWKQQI